MYRTNPPQKTYWPCAISLIALLLLAGCGAAQRASPTRPTARIALDIPHTPTTPAQHIAATPPHASPTVQTSALLASPTQLPVTPSVTAIPSPSYIFVPTATLGVASDAPSNDGALDADAVELHIFILINQLRAQNNVPPLAYSPVLGAAARAHSCDMAAHHAINHLSSDGQTLAQRIPASSPPWEWPSENIAAGFGDAEAVVQAWFDESPPDDWHRRNILAIEQRELGIGYCYNADGGSGNEHFYTADFGRRTDLYPLVLANGDTTTHDGNVPFWLYGEGWADAMRLGTTPDLAALPWQPFTAQGSFPLTAAPSAQTVYAELRGPGGTTEIVSATITLVP